MIKGESIDDVLGLFDFWTFTGVNIDPTNLYPIYNDVIHFSSKFTLPKNIAITDVLHFVEVYNPPRYNDMLTFIDQFVGVHSTSWDDDLLFVDIFDAGYYHASREIDDNIDFKSYFTYLLVPNC